MSKTKNNPPAVDDSPVSTEQQPAYVDELLTNGTTILTAKTRDGLAEMVNTIPADVHYSAGAVAVNHETGVFALRVDISK